MAKWTKRDKIWNIALKKDDLHPSDLYDRPEFSERLVRDTLQTMSDSGVLVKQGGEGRTPVTYSTAVDHPVP